MFRVGLLLRALPSILFELMSLVWYSYRTGDRRMAVVALTWLTSLVLLIGFAASAVVGAVRGEQVELKGTFLAASIPAWMWIARELLALLASLLGRLLSLVGLRPAADLGPDR